jgi:hypothetical protein
MAYSARPTSSNALTELVSLTAHGFVVGQVIIYDGAWVLAEASSLAACAGSWMVSIVIDANDFYVTQTGYVGPFTAAAGNDVPYTPGVQYYLSPTSAGHLTTVMPAAAGQVVLPCFVADSTDTGYFYGGSGTLVESGQLFSWSTVNTNVANTGVNKGYFTSSGGTITLTLPPDGSVAVGDEIRVSNLAGNFEILLHASQTINFGDVVAATSITSSAVGDSIELVCYQSTPHVLYNALSIIGNLTPI